MLLSRPDLTARPLVKQGAHWIAGLVAIGIIGWIDFVTGTELRVLPLYYGPIALLSWYAGRTGTAVGAGLSALTWFESNLLAGLEFSRPQVWVANTLLQGVSFVTVGLLIATLRASLIRERLLSRIDPLTTLLNRRAFYEEAGGILSLCRRQGRPVTLAYIDLDDFKTVNDTLGHQAGDDLLRNVGGWLKTSVRPSDLCSRLGGDEFAVLLPGADAAEATRALEQIRSRLSEFTATIRSGVTLSIGAVTFMTVPATLEAMVSAADARMYAAKAEGKDRLRLEVLDGDAV